MKKVMRFFLAFNFLTIATSLFAQVYPKSQVFRYEMENATGKAALLGFNSERIFLNDSVFIDKGILCSDDTAEICSITFKKIGLNWFVKANNEWQEFFSTTDSLIKVVYFKDEKFILKPVGVSYLFQDVSLYGFTREQLYVKSSHMSHMGFDPRYGIVMFDGNGNFGPYIRKDVAKNE